jgi:RNA polymerase sigma-70 factor (ECF subfamily)
MESLKQFSGRSRLSTWLFVVVRRIALRHLARLRRLPASTELDLCDLIPEPSGQAIEQTEKLELIQQARQQLSPADQEVLRMFYDAEMPYDQLASVLNISVNTVGPKLDRARRRLRALMKPPPDD